MSLLYDTLPSVQRQVDDLFDKPFLHKYRPHNPLELDSSLTQPGTELGLEFPSSPKYHSPPECNSLRYLEPELFNDVPSCFNLIGRKQLTEYVCLLKEATICASELIHLKAQNERSYFHDSVRNIRLLIPSVFKVNEASDFLKYSIDIINDQYKKDLSTAILDSKKLELLNYLFSLKTEVIVEEFMTKINTSLNSLEDSIPKEEFKKLSLLVDSLFKPTFCQMLQHILYLFHVYLKKCIAIFDERYPHFATIEKARNPLPVRIKHANHIREELPPKTNNNISPQTPDQQDISIKESINQFLDDAMKCAQTTSVGSSPGEKYKYYHPYNQRGFKMSETKQSMYTPHAHSHTNYNTHSHYKSYSFSTDNRLGNKGNYNSNKRYPKSRYHPFIDHYRPYRPKQYNPSNSPKPYPKPNHYCKN